MKPTINHSEFGSITVDQIGYDHDILITLSGEIKKRKKKLSKKFFGTSHILSRQEAKYIYEKGADGIIIGSGQSGQLRLSDEAEEYFTRKKCKIKLLPTPQAIKLWNESKGKSIGLFHITC
jgi:hypothetical protein